MHVLARWVVADGAGPRHVGPSHPHHDEMTARFPGEPEEGRQDAGQVTVTGSVLGSMAHCYLCWSWSEASP